MRNVLQLLQMVGLAADTPKGNRSRTPSSIDDPSYHEIAGDSKGRKPRFTPDSLPKTGIASRSQSRSLIVAFALLLPTQLGAQTFGRIVWKNGTAAVTRDTGVVHWTVVSSDGSRGFQQRVTKLQATGLWMLSRAAILPDSQRSLPFDYACCRVNFLYSKSAVTGTLTIKGKAGYWQPSKPLTVQQALTVFDWLMYAADSVTVPSVVIDLR